MIVLKIIETWLEYYDISLPQEGMGALADRVVKLSEETRTPSEAIGLITNSSEEGLLPLLIHIRNIQKTDTFSPSRRNVEIGLSDVEFLVATRYPGISSSSRTELLKDSFFRFYENIFFDKAGRNLPPSAIFPRNAYHLGLICSELYQESENVMDGLLRKEVLERARVFVNMARQNGYVHSDRIKDSEVRMGVTKTDVLDANLLILEAGLIEESERMPIYKDAIRLLEIADKEQLTNHCTARLHRTFAKSLLGINPSPEQYNRAGVHYEVGITILNPEDHLRQTMEQEFKKWDL